MPGTLILLSGPAGCGKTTMLNLLRAYLRRNDSKKLRRVVTCLDADRFHLRSVKLAARRLVDPIPMTDGYRRCVWIPRIKRDLGLRFASSRRNGKVVVLACSALSEWVRDEFRAYAESRGLNFKLIWLGPNAENTGDGVLEATKARLQKRIENGTHWFRPELAPSQFAACQIPKEAADVQFVDAYSQGIQATFADVRDVVDRAANVVLQRSARHSVKAARRAKRIRPTRITAFGAHA